MVVHISSLPPHLQVEITEKMGYTDFINFQSSSCNSKSISNKMRHKIWHEGKADDCLKIFHLEDENRMKICYHNCNIWGDWKNKRKQIEVPENTNIAFRVSTIVLKHNLTESFCQLLLKTLPLLQFSAESLSLFDGCIDCHGNSWNQLLIVLGTQSLVIKQQLPSASARRTFSPKYLETSASRRLGSIRITLFKECALTDDLLLSLNARNLMFRSTAITPHGINRLLKEWINGKREITRVAITGKLSGFKEDDLLSGINASVHVEGDRKYFTVEKNKEMFWVLWTVGDNGVFYEVMDENRRKAGFSFNF